MGLKVMSAQTTGGAAFGINVMWVEAKADME
jgi:hypothetical protein